VRIDTHERETNSMLAFSLCEPAKRVVEVAQTKIGLAQSHGGPVAAASRRAHRWPEASDNVFANLTGQGLTCRRPSEAIGLGEGVIYPVLHGLEESGSVKPKRKQVNSRERVYYSVTAKGRRRLEHLSGEWK
jgi:hypothetical protein